MNKLSLVFLSFIFTGCASILRHPVSVSNARLGAKTKFYEDLTSLPKPQEKIAAAVYKFRDQTGQYKLLEAGSSWSTVVTQGATSILIEAMEESGWFIPIEREGLSNLLNERKIIRSSRMQYLNENENQQSVLPPLLFAGIILEGGIISFDSNIRTGGGGLRYFGAGASGQYREDRVTIYLRAVSTSNGRILKTVYTTKTILSQKIDVGIFRYVKFKRLLEAETGYTYNEPSEIAVKEAIEKAVYALIIEGIEDGLWPLENPEDVNNQVITDFFKEKELNQTTDYLGFSENYDRKFFGIGIQGRTNYFEGDLPGSTFTTAGDLSLGFAKQNRLSFNLNIGLGQLGGSSHFTENINYTEILASYRLMNNNRFSPTLHFGSGLISQDLKDLTEQSFSTWAYPYISIGIGYEYLFKNNLEFNLDLSNNIFYDDRFDNISQGNYNDFYWSLKLGIHYYLTIGRK
ncbi:MAG: CsgG/HfaB family protein [bacterium]